MDNFYLLLQGSDYISSLSLGDEHDCGNRTPGSQHLSICSGDMDPAMREAMVANAAAAAVTAFANAAANSGGGGLAEQGGNQLPPMPPGGQPRGEGSDAGQVALSSRQSAGNSSPPRQYSYMPGRPPSFHDLARAMREFHEQQMVELAEQREAAARANASVATPVANGVGGHGVGELGSFNSGSTNGLLDSPPMVEVKLPNGALSNPTVLAKVAATAATAAATALNEVMPQRNGQTAPVPVCTIASYSNCKDDC